jgi:hypothetical protein
VSDETIQKLKRELARSGTSPRDIALGISTNNPAKKRKST